VTVFACFDGLIDDFLDLFLEGLEVFLLHLPVLEGFLIELDDKGALHRIIMLALIKILIKIIFARFPIGPEPSDAILLIL